MTGSDPAFHPSSWCCRGETCYIHISWARGSCQWITCECIVDKSDNWEQSDLPRVYASRCSVVQWWFGLIPVYSLVTDSLKQCWKTLAPMCFLPLGILGNVWRLSHTTPVAWTLSYVSQLQICPLPISPFKLCYRAHNCNQHKEVAKNQSYKLFTYVFHFWFHIAAWYSDIHGTSFIFQAYGFIWQQADFYFSYTAVVGNKHKISADPNNMPFQQMAILSLPFRPLWGASCYG